MVTYASSGCNGGAWTENTYSLETNINYRGLYNTSSKRLHIHERIYTWLEEQFLNLPEKKPIYWLVICLQAIVLWLYCVGTQLKKNTIILDCVWVTPTLYYSTFPSFPPESSPVGISSALSDPSPCTSIRASNSICQLNSPGPPYLPGGVAQRTKLRTRADRERCS